MSVECGENGGAVVLLSGGMDSVTLLHYAAVTLRRAPLHALSFRYGQRHVRELLAARTQAARVGVSAHETIDLSVLGGLLRRGSALIDGGMEVPDLDQLEASQRRQPPTYVPNRNMILLAVAAAYAEANGCREVYYGAQAQDEYGYWDCTAEFLERINAALALNREQPIVVRAPFINWKKADILRTGIALGVDYSQTWTCYRGGEKACGTCPTCVERLRAFASLGLRDPLS